MRDRDRLAQMLRTVARPAKAKRPGIVCYDFAWAGLPRITAYDPPSRRKAGGRKRTQRAVPVRPNANLKRAAAPAQFVLPLGMSA
jgi:hypothetical protein